MIYTAPASISASATDNVTYSVYDEYNDAVATASASVPLSAGGSGSSSIITLSGSDTSPVINQSNVTIIGTGSFSLFIGGTHDVAILTHGAETVIASGGYNTITTGGGNDTIEIASSRNLVNAGAGSNSIYNIGSDNTIVLPAGGDGRDTIYGQVLQQGDTMDLRPVLAATSWNGSQDTLADYLSMATTGGGANAVLLANNTSTGSGGYHATVAVFEWSGALSLSQLLAHAIT